MELFILLVLVVSMACFLLAAFDRAVDGRATRGNLIPLGLFFLAGAFFLGQLDKLS